ncbi:GNAT family N-acetyltransferase [Crocinitomicaceae bacterium]|nr:GNAT family N-acetyltransferase [Crocinitomicaceae bacterium]
MEVRSPQIAKEWEDYYDLRYRILREPLEQPRGSEKNEGDATGIHLALYDQGILRAIARLDQAEPKISQTRFVAVDASTRGKGYGRIIMEAAERKSQEMGNEKMILHARDYALDFYLKIGYTNIEKSYKLYDVLQHFLMEKVY